MLPKGVIIICKVNIDIMIIISKIIHLRKEVYRMGL